MHNPSNPLNPLSISMPVGAVVAYAGVSDSPESGTSNSAWPDSLTCKPDSNNPGQSSDSVRPLENTGWMLCDGRELLQAQYPELFAVIGYIYGKGSEEGRFRIPDCRGMFLRGVDDGAGMDPGPRAAPAGAAGGSSNGVGSLQCDALQDHAHEYILGSTAVTGDQGAGSAAPGTAPNAETTAPVDAPQSSDTVRVSSETRPVNIAMNFIIKFTHGPGGPFVGAV